MRQLIFPQPFGEVFYSMIYKHVPKWICGVDWDKTQRVLEEFTAHLTRSKNLLNEVSSNQEIEQSKQQIDYLINFLNSKKDDSLTSLIEDLKSLKEDINRSVDEEITNQNIHFTQNHFLSPAPIPSRFEKFKQMVLSIKKNQQETFLEKEFKTQLSDEFWQEVAKNKINQLKEDFNLKNIIVTHQNSWYEIYSWANDMNKVLAEVQEQMGLEKSHAGLNKTISISFNPAFLNYHQANGSMTTGKYSNIVFLAHFNKTQQKSIWQHEFTHCLDNRLAIEYMKSMNYEIPEDGHLYFSKIIMNELLNKENHPKSLNKNINLARQSMKEALCLAVFGQSSTDIDKNNEKLLKDFLMKTGICFYEFICPEFSFLSIQEKEKFINTPDSQQFLKLLSEKLYFDMKNEICDFIFNESCPGTEELQKMFQKIGLKLSHFGKKKTSEFYSQTFEKLNSEKENIKFSLKDIFNEFGYAHTERTPYFMKSLTGHAATNKTLLDNRVYWANIIEIFARSSENLQQPLYTYSNEQLLSMEKPTGNSSNYLNPLLNLGERKVFIQAIHHMIMALGGQIKDDCEILTYRKYPQTQAMEIHQTYSTVSGNEQIPSTVYQLIQAQRNQNISKKANKI